MIRNNILTLKTDYVLVSYIKCKTVVCVWMRELILWWNTNSHSIIEYRNPLTSRSHTYV